jgi:hypothetical protein
MTVAPRGVVPYLRDPVTGLHLVSGEHGTSWANRFAASFPIAPGRERDEGVLARRRAESSEVSARGLSTKVLVYEGRDPGKVHPAVYAYAEYDKTRRSVHAEYLEARTWVDLLPIVVRIAPPSTP